MGSDCISSWSLLIFLLWINRFVENCQKKRLDRISGELTIDELKKAEIKQTQCTEFQEEWKALTHRRPLTYQSANHEDGVPLIVQAALSKFGLPCAFLGKSDLYSFS